MSVAAPNQFQRGGIALIVVALVWWFVFFTQVARFTGDNTARVLQTTFPCTVVTTQTCAFIYLGAQVGGYAPYQPALMWLGLALFVAGRIWQGHTEQGSDIKLEKARFETTEPTQFYSPHPDFDVNKWNALLKYDQELAEIAALFEPLGQKWVDRFASDYLAINDKAYLPEIARKIMVDAKAEHERNKSRSGAYGGSWTGT